MNRQKREKDWWVQRWSGTNFQAIWIFYILLAMNSRKSVNPEAQSLLYFFLPHYLFSPSTFKSTYQNNKNMLKIIDKYCQKSKSSYLLFSCQVMSDSSQTHGLQHAWLPCPSPSPRVCPSSCPLNQWYHPTILPSVTESCY